MHPARHPRPKADGVAARVIVLEGAVVSAAKLERIKTYCINPVDSREASLAKPGTLEMAIEVLPDVRILEGFCGFGPERGWKSCAGNWAWPWTSAISFFPRTYFREGEQRDPTLTEIRMLDTYWSDHCRHTTFLTRLEKVEFESGAMNEPVREAYEEYLRCRDSVSGGQNRDVTLMDIARMGMSDLARAREARRPRRFR